MKLYIKEVDGCIWCPHHMRRGYSNDKATEGRCKAMFSRKNNYKLIREHEMCNREHPQNPYYAFPEWCPLKDKINEIDESMCQEG